MLIDLHELILKYDLKILDILHVGAHKCEELELYYNIGAKDKNIYWIEANPELVEFNKNNNKNINIYQGVIYHEDNKEVEFKITNNLQSSSILNFGTHKTNHPEVSFTKYVNLKTIRLDTLIKKNNIKIENINFINLDIQGVELSALKSMDSYLNYIDYIYTEVNTEEVYENCDKLDDITNYLKQYNFKLVAQKMWNNGSCGWGDAFYIKKT